MLKCVLALTPIGCQYLQGYIRPGQHQVQLDHHVPLQRGANQACDRSLQFSEAVIRHAQADIQKQIVMPFCPADNCYNRLT